MLKPRHQEEMFSLHSWLVGKADERMTRLFLSVGGVWASCLERVMRA